MSYYTRKNYSKAPFVDAGSTKLL